MENTALNRVVMNSVIELMRRKRRQNIISLHEKGWSNSQIAGAFNIPESVVRNIIKDGA